MSFYKIRPRGGTASQWSTANPVLAEREIGYEYPVGGLGAGAVKMKMGDGVTPWNSLPYAEVPLIELLGPTEVSPATSAHAVGDLIVYNGLIYRVTTAIAVGATLTVGGNIAETEITTYLNSIVAKIGNSAMGTSATTVTGAIREHETDIAGLKTLISTATFKIVEKAFDNISIAADWYYDKSGFNVTLSGYRALAIAGFGVYQATSGGVYANWCLFQKCVLFRSSTADFLDFYVWNQNTSATAKVKIRVWILYVKTGLI